MSLLPWLRRHAPAANDISAMAERGDVDGIRRALRHGNLCVRLAALQALPALLPRDEVAPTIGVLLEEADRDFRYNAVVLLGRWGDPVAAPFLLPMLEDENDMVRSATAVALGRVGNRGGEVVTALIDALRRDPWFSARQSAAVSLGELRAAEAFDAIVGATRDENAGVRHAAAVALGRLGDRRAVPALTALLEDPVDIVRLRASQELDRLARGDWPVGR